MKKTTKPRKGVKKAVKKDKGKAKMMTAECFHCHKSGHWKRNCPEYLASLTKNKQVVASSTGVFVTQNCFSINHTSWVLDTGSGSHICNLLQGLKSYRKLGAGEMTMQVGNGAIVAALAVGDFHLALPNGNVLILNSCYFVPTMMCNIISISLLDKDGYVFKLENNVMNIIFNQKLIAYGTLCNGIYILNQNTILNTYHTNKRKHSVMNDTFLWHCRLGHINKERLGELHKHGYLDPFDFESYETCKSCLKGKMTKTPFTGTGVRVTELLGLIHSDVCGPMSTMARGGYSYFITFTDDFSRFGHVFLMKHKSKTFEKFIEYKNEVENQTSK